MRLWIVLSLAAVVAGCSDAPSSEPALGGPQLERSVAYTCEDGSEFVITFEEAGDAVVSVDGETLRLENQRPASGMWYASPRHSFRGKGSDAMWTVGRMTPVSCEAS